MPADNLLASAPTLDRLHKMIGQFYCGTATRLEPAAANVWIVIRESDGKHLAGVTVCQRRNRFRFEMTA